MREKQSSEEVLKSMFREEARKQLKPLINANSQLRLVNARLARQNERLNQENQQLVEGLEIALGVISGMKGQKKGDRGQILDYLGLPTGHLEQADDSTVSDVNTALRRVSMIVHPDAHPDESPLVKRALGFLAMPVTVGLDKIKRRE